MPLSEKTKSWLFAPFAISPIIKWCALPGLIGMALFVVGVVKKLGWLKVIGVVLAAPVLWCYFVLIFIYFPMLIFDSLRRRKTQGR